MILSYCVSVTSRIGCITALSRMASSSISGLADSSLTVRGFILDCSTLNWQPRGLILDGLFQHWLRYRLGWIFGGPNVRRFHFRKNLWKLKILQRFRRRLFEIKLPVCASKVLLFTAKLLIYARIKNWIVNRHIWPSFSTKKMAAISGKRFRLICGE